EASRSEVDRDARRHGVPARTQPKPTTAEVGHGTVAAQVLRRVAQRERLRPTADVALNPRQGHAGHDVFYFARDLRDAGQPWVHQGVAPLTQADPDQCARPPVPAACVCTYWPVVQAVVGLAVTACGVPAIRSATVAGGVLPVGVQLPGTPAVAPVAAVAPPPSTTSDDVASPN